MSGPGAVAEEAPVLVGLYMTLEAVLTWLLERALLLIWIFTLGALLKLLANLLTYDKWVVHIHWGGPFARLESDVHGWLVEQVVIQEFAIGWWWHQTSRIQGWIAHETWATMRDVFRWGVWMSDVYVPTYVHGLTDILHATTRTVTKQVTVVTHKTTAITRDVVIPHAGELKWIHTHWKALTRAVAAGGAIALFPPLAIPKIWHGIDDLRKWRVHVNKRLLKLEALFGATALAVAMSNVLGVPWRCLRPRGPIGRLAKALCGLETALLAALLATAFEAFAILDLCGLVSAEEKLAAWFRPLLMELVDVDEWLIKNCGYSAPAPLTLPKIKLPKGRYGLTLNEELDYKLGLAG